MPHHVVIYLGGDRILQAPEAGQDVGYGTISEFAGQIATVRLGPATPRPATAMT